MNVSRLYGFHASISEVQVSDHACYDEADAGDLGL